MKYISYMILFLVCLGHSASAQNTETIDYERLAHYPVVELFQTGENHFKQSHTDTAMAYYIIVVGKYNQSMTDADKTLCALACIYIAETYFKQNNYQQSFEMCFKGIKICEESKNERLLARFYKNIGNIYNIYQDLPLAINYYKKGLKLANKHQCMDVKARLLSNLTTTYTNLNDLENAEKYYQELLDFPYTDSIKTYNNYFNQALIYVTSNRYQEAVEPFRKAGKYALETKLEPQYVTSAIGDLAILYQKLNQIDSALYYFHKNEEYTQKERIPYYYISTLKHLTFLYDSIGDKDKSNYYRQRQLVLSDSILNQEKYNNLKNAQTVYELEKNYKKINSLTIDKAQKEAMVAKQRRTILLISFGLCLLIVITVYIYHEKKKLFVAYTDLYRKNKELASSEQTLRALRNENEQHLLLLQQMLQNAHSSAEEKTVTDAAEQTTTAGTEQELKRECRTESAATQIEQKKELLKQITYIMEETDKFCDIDFTLEHLASLVNSNSKYVSQIINETYKKNFRTFVNEYRIKQACVRLADQKNYGHLTIQAIGESVGYKSRTNFSEIFKKITGLPPALYQKMAQEGSKTV